MDALWRRSSATAGMRVRRLFPNRYERNILRSAAQSVLLMSAMQEGNEGRFPPNVKSTHTLWGIKFVTRQRQVIHLHHAHIHFHLARRLHCITMKQDFALTAQFRNFLNRKQHARFVVCPHQRHDRCLVGDCVLQVGHVQQSVTIHRQASDATTLFFQRLAMIQNRGMFDSRSGRYAVFAGFDLRTA